MNTLYHLPFSADSRLVRIALAEKKIDIKLIVEPIWERRNKFLSINPEGTVPVLVTNDNIAISGASVIIEWLEDISSFNTLIGTEVKFRAESRRIMSWFTNKFSSEVEASIVFEKIMKVFIFNFKPKEKAFNLKVTFSKGRVETSEIIKALESAIKKLRSGR